MKELTKKKLSMTKWLLRDESEFIKLMDKACELGYIKPEFIPEQWAHIVWFPEKPDMNYLTFYYNKNASEKEILEEFNDEKFVTGYKPMNFSDYFEYDYEYETLEEMQRAEEKPKILDNVDIKSFSIDKNPLPGCALNVINELASDTMMSLAKEEEDEIIKFIRDKIYFNIDKDGNRKLKVWPEKGSFMWAIEQMKEGKRVKQKTWDNYAIYSNPQQNRLLFYNHPNKCIDYSGRIIDFDSEWELYEEPNPYKDMTIEELIYQAHMKGQADFGCLAPGYSNAQGDCKKIVDAANKRISEIKNEA